MGYDLFVILILRLLWRWLNPVPELPVGLQRWEHVAARLSHAGLYVLMFIVSLTGWMVATTFRVPMTKDLLGIDVPPLVTTVDRSVRQWIEESHMVLAYVLAAVVLIHVVAALRHTLSSAMTCCGACSGAGALTPISRAPAMAGSAPSALSNAQSRS